MKTLLIVDDSPFDRKFIEQSAIQVGLSVNVVSNGDEALAACDTSFPDCILVDWEMKGMNGIELLERLRQMDKGKDAVIIICTSHEHPSFIGHAHMRGANGYIVKPITPDKLQAELTKLEFL